MRNSAKPWEDSFPAFKIWGNLYYVGTVPASTHIVDTGEGLIMFDSGYQHTLYLVIDGIYRLGFKLSDVKYIIHTHGHIDHMGATRALVELTGAKTVIGRKDRDYANGEADLSYAKELGMQYEQEFEPDILLEDGDTIALGNTVVRCIATPGHTPGAMSYVFDVTDGRECYKAGLHGGMGLNTMCRSYLDKYNLNYGCRDEFIRAMNRLKEESVDIFLGNHMYHSHTAEKYGIICDGNTKAFINPKEWGEYAEWAKQNLLKMIERENDPASKNGTAAER